MRCPIGLRWGVHYLYSYTLRVTSGMISSSIEHQTPPSYTCTHYGSRVHLLPPPLSSFRLFKKYSSPSFFCFLGGGILERAAFANNSSIRILIFDTCIYLTYARTCTHAHTCKNTRTCARTRTHTHRARTHAHTFT